MDNQRDNPPTTISLATRVEDLPVGLLGRALIQHLPRKLRAQMEGVCTSWREEALAYGWEDVKRLEWGQNGGVCLQPTSWVPLLSRVAPHLTALDLCTLNNVLELGEEKLLAGLRKCPKLRHLSVWRKQLTPPVLDHICSAYASKLKSLRLFAEELDDPEMATALSKALSLLPALEWLSVENWLRSEVELRLPDNTRHLAFPSCKLSQSSFEALAALPSLRSLTLWEEGNVKKLDFSALRCFPHLEHLNIEIGLSNVASFVEALPHLGASLKALEVQIWLRSAVLKQLIPPITAHLHRLEHLELWTKEESNQQEDAVEMEQMLGSLQLNNLRSLSFWVLLRVGWGWLKRICQEYQQRLEYLELYEAPPLTTLCSVVRECNVGSFGSNTDSFLSLIELSYNELQRLSGIRLINNPRWEAVDVVTLAEAAAPLRQNDGDVKEGLESRHLLPTLHIAFDGADEMQTKWEIGDFSRLRFVSYNKLWSKVLDQHRFGCLSEGCPTFGNME